MNVKDCFTTKKYFLDFENCHNCFELYFDNSLKINKILSDDVPNNCNIMGSGCYVTLDSGEKIFVAKFIDWQEGKNADLSRYEDLYLLIEQNLYQVNSETENNTFSLKRQALFKRAFTINEQTFIYKYSLFQYYLDFTRTDFDDSTDFFYDFVEYVKLIRKRNNHSKK